MTDQKTWNNLCQAAVEFRDLACWEWTDDTTLFAVENPKTGETGFCSIMGQQGEFTALGVYLGDFGWTLLAAIIAGVFDEQPDIVRFNQKCLMASFEDRGDLQEQDRALLKIAGIKPRGRGEWPIFRSHRPGYLPWHLEPDEAEFLTLALQQATWFGIQVRERPDMFKPPQPAFILTRVAMRLAEGELEWRTEWKPVPKIVAPEVEVPSVDVESLSDLSRLKPWGPWAYDLLWLPTPFADPGGRPKYPRISFCLAIETDFIIDSQFVEPHGYADTCVRRLAERMRRTGKRPTEWIIREESAYRVLQPLAEALDVPIHRQDHLPELDRVVSQYLSYLNL